MKPAKRTETFSRYFRLRVEKKTLIILSALIITIMAWFFSYPQFGPLISGFFNKLEALSIDRGNWVMLFLASASFSSILSGYVLDKTQKKIKLIYLSAPILTLLTFSLVWQNFENVFLFAIPTGVVAGLLLVAMGVYFAGTVLPEDRGRIMGIAIGISMIIAQIFLVIGPIEMGTKINFMPFIIGVLPLLAVVALLFRPKEKTQDSPTVKPRKGPPTKKIALFAIPIFLFYIVVGILLSIVFPSIQDQVSELAFYLIWIVPFVIGAIFAGIQLDMNGRKFPTITGLAITGVSVAILGILGVKLGYLVIIPIAIGYSYVTISSLIIWADLAPAEKRGMFYGVGFSLIAAAQMVGLILTGTYFGSASNAQINSYMLFSSIALFLCIPPLLLAEEALPKELIEKRQLADYLDGFKNKVTKKKPT